jgi:hypothetical protein
MSVRGDGTHGGCIVDERDQQRRGLIKKAAVAGGIVWASPVIQSMTSPASAAGTPDPTTTETSTTAPGECTTCNPVPACGGSTTVFCGPTGDPLVCACYQTVEGDCVCTQPGSCRFPVPVCNTSADCPAGERCFDFCGDCEGESRLCAPLCGSSGDESRTPTSGGSPLLP